MAILLLCTLAGRQFSPIRRPQWLQPFIVETPAHKDDFESEKRRPGLAANTLLAISLVGLSAEVVRVAVLAPHPGSALSVVPWV